MMKRTKPAAANLTLTLPDSPESKPPTSIKCNLHSLYFFDCLLAFIFFRHSKIISFTLLQFPKGNTPYFLWSFVKEWPFSFFPNGIALNNNDGNRITEFTLCLLLWVANAWISSLVGRTLLCIPAGTPRSSARRWLHDEPQALPSPPFPLPLDFCPDDVVAVKQRPLSAAGVHRSGPGFPACHSSVLKMIKSRATHPGYGEHGNILQLGTLHPRLYTGGACPGGSGAAWGLLLSASGAYTVWKTEHTNQRSSLLLEASFTTLHPKTHRLTARYEISFFLHWPDS